MRLVHDSIDAGGQLVTVPFHSAFVTGGPYRDVCYCVIKS